MAKMIDTDDKVVITGTEINVIKTTRKLVREWLDEMPIDDVMMALDEAQGNAETTNAYVIIEIEAGEI